MWRTSPIVMSSRSVPTHSGRWALIGSSTPAMWPSSTAMPTTALVKLLATDQLAAHESAPAPSAYHSATISPSCTTTTPWVSRPGAKA
jgi:hypothetical protein